MFALEEEYAPWLVSCLFFNQHLHDWARRLDRWGWASDFTSSRRQFGAFVQRAEVFLVGENAVAFLAGDFADEAERRQEAEGGVGGK